MEEMTQQLVHEHHNQQAAAAVLDSIPDLGNPDDVKLLQSTLGSIRNVSQASSKLLLATPCSSESGRVVTESTRSVTPYCDAIALTKSTLQQKQWRRSSCPPAPSIPHVNTHNIRPSRRTERKIHRITPSRRHLSRLSDDIPQTTNNTDST